MDCEFLVHCGAFNSDSGSNHLSSTCPSSQRSQLRDRSLLESGKYRTNVDANICRLSNTQHSKTKVPPFQVPETQVCKTQVLEPQVAKPQMPKPLVLETQVPEI